MRVPRGCKFYGEQAKKAVMKQLLKRLPEAVGAPPEMPVELDGMDLEDDVAGIINAEQGSYTVRDVDASTGEVLDARHRRHYQSRRTSNARPLTSQ